MNKRFTSMMTTLILSVFLAVSASAYDVEEDGIYYSIDRNTVSVIRGDIEYSGDIVIPESISINDTKYSVTSIGKQAFYHCSNLTSISIPNTVTSINDYAFDSCKGLTSVKIPNSVTSLGNFVFQDCIGLTSVKIPNSVTSLGMYAFGGCSSLSIVQIPNSVTYIGDGAFGGCDRLTQTLIVNDMFVFLPRLYTGHFSIPENITKIIGGAFSNCSYLTSVTIPNSVSSIGSCAFLGCSGLTSVTIPNSVKIIGSSAFYNCSGLTSVSIPNSITSIEDLTFDGCINLTSLTIPNSIAIPNSVTSIGYRAFGRCKSITSVMIPSSITSIGEFAFAECSGLTSVTIPNSVTNIGICAFLECYSIKNLVYDCSVNPDIQSYSLRELYIGDNVSIVYDYFNGLELNKIVLGKNVSQIVTQAFSNAKIEEFSVTSEEPPHLDDNVFGTQDLSKATLYVPESKTEYYQTTEPWSKFGNIIPLIGEVSSIPEKCATPSISYIDGTIKFSCETDGVKYLSSIVSDDLKKSNTEDVNLSCYYNISVIATKEGFINSDLATAKLYWLTPSESADTDIINAYKTRGIIIMCADGFITISGLDTKEIVDFYTTEGKTLGSVESVDGSVSFSAKQGTVVMAKIGNESVKIDVK